jgi:hypothetical protein
MIDKLEMLLALARQQHSAGATPVAVHRLHARGSGRAGLGAPHGRSDGTVRERDAGAARGDDGAAGADQIDPDRRFDFAADDWVDLSPARAVDPADGRAGDAGSAFRAGWMETL